MNGKKVLSLLAGAMLLATAACGADKMVTFNLAVEPRTIDPVLNNAVDGSIVIVNIFEGLVRIGFNDAPEPGCAESWDVSDDGTTWTFHLRDGLKWSDGKPLTSDDFRYGFERLLDSANASPYAYLGYFIKNGEKFFKGQAKVEDLGIETPDDRTVILHLDYQAPLLLDYLSYHVFYPARRDVVSKDPRGWTLNTQPLVCNGPFFVSEWKHNSEMTLLKNPYYWDADNVKIDAVKMVMITDSNTALAAYKSGNVDLINQLPPLMTPQLLASGEAKVAPTLGTSFSVFNTTRKPFDDVRVRKAFALAVDRQVLVDKVTMGGQKPAQAFIPFIIPGVDPAGKDFRAEDPTEYLPIHADVAAAQKLLEEAGYPGGKGFPTVTYVYNGNPTNKAIAEALQAMWKQNLGVTVELSQQEWKVFIDTRVQKNYDIARHAYLVDFFDAASLLDLWISDSFENVVGFNNAEYDALMRDSARQMDRAKRIDDLHKAEKILLENMPVLPLYYYSTPYLLKSRVEGVYLSPRNWVFFRGASVK